MNIMATMTTIRRKNIVPAITLIRIRVLTSRIAELQSVICPTVGPSSSQRGSSGDDTIKSQDESTDTAATLPANNVGSEAIHCSKSVTVCDEACLSVGMI